MEEKIIELFDTIKESTDNSEHRMTKLKLLTHIALIDVRKMYLSNEVKDKKILENLKIVLSYIYYNFNSFYELDKKFEKGFDSKSEYLGVYIGKFDVNEEAIQMLNYLVNLVGISFFDNETLEVHECPGVKNLEMLRLKKVYK